MKYEKVSMKWKVFFYLLGFAVVLLVILWLFQICYLDTFYKAIKTSEAQKAMESMEHLLAANDTLPEESIDKLASECNLSILVSDSAGNAIYVAEYTPSSKMKNIPQQEFLQYYQKAKDNGGSAKIEYKGNRNMAQQQPDGIFNSAEAENDGADEVLPPEKNFIKGRDQEFGESVIYVKLMTKAQQELVVMVNSLITPVDATVATLQIQLVCISIILLVLSLLIALLLSKNISKPIVHINEMAKVLAKGTYHVEFSGKDYREIAELSNTLNYTARELEKTENLRRELIANISHDLRTPLTMIIAYAEVMRDLPGENTPENIQVVIDESRRLTNLVNDMLDISKLQAGVMEQELSVYNLTESIQSVLLRYNKLIEQDGYTIDFEYDQEIFVEADEFKIFQVIYNLINNAINYTGKDKIVTVRQRMLLNQVRIEVSDTGEGIRQEDRPLIWDRYYKVDKNHKRAVAGTGLGLSIVKNILVLHHAAYGVDSEPHRGSTFWFELKSCGNVDENI